MSGLFGTLFDGTPFNQRNGDDFHRFNAPWPHPVIEYSQEERDHMSKGGCIYHFGWTWNGKHGGRYSIRCGPFLDADKGEQEFLITLFKMGYRLPKWWEMSRWGEKRLSRDRRDAIEAMEKQA